MPYVRSGQNNHGSFNMEIWLIMILSWDYYINLDD